MENLTFEQLQEEKKAIEKRVNQYSDALNSFPKNEIGLIPDIYKKSDEYIEARKQFNFWWKNLQNINKYIAKNHKKENYDYQMKNRFKK